MVSVKIKQGIIAEEEARLLRLVRARNGVSRVQAAGELCLSPATIGKYVDRLVFDGFLLNGAKTPTGRGRPAIPLQLNPAGGVILGISVAGYIRLVCMDFAENVLNQRQEPVERGASVDAVLEHMGRMLGEMADATDAPLLTVGVAHPGMVADGRGGTGEREYAQKLPEAPIADVLTRMLDVPVVVETDTRAAAYGEMCFGLGRDLSSFVCVSAISSIGAAVITDGRLHGGHARRGGDVGCWTCPAELFPSAVFPGNQAAQGVAVEDVASVWSLVNRVKAAAEAAGDTDLIRSLVDPVFPAIVRIFTEGDHAVVNREVSVAATALGWVTGHLVELLDPERVVLCGPLTKLGPKFLAQTAEVMAEHIRPRHLDPPPLFLSETTMYGVAIGAAASALHAWAPAR